MALWTLRHGNEAPGVIEVVGRDQPWITGRWDPTEAFVDFAPLFERELACLNADDIEAFERAYEAIYDAGLSLLSPDDVQAAEWLLHIDGQEAWFRWSDEPFEAS